MQYLLREQNGIYYKNAYIKQQEAPIKHRLVTKLLLSVILNENGNEREKKGRSKLKRMMQHL